MYDEPGARRAAKKNGHSRQPAEKPGARSHTHAQYRETSRRRRGEVPSFWSTQTHISIKHEICRLDLGVKASPIIKANIGIPLTTKRLPRYLALFRMMLLLLGTLVFHCTYYKHASFTLPTRPHTPWISHQTLFLFLLLGSLLADRRNDLCSICSQNGSGKLACCFFFLLLLLQS